LAPSPALLAQDRKGLDDRVAEHERTGAVGRRTVVAVLATVVVAAMAGVLAVVVKGSGGVPDIATTATLYSPVVPVVPGAGGGSGGVPASDAAVPCPDGMVLVPGDTFTMGAADGDSDEKPPHPVKLSTFCIDRTEVTVADYRRCTKETRNDARCSPAPTEVKWEGADVESWSQFCNGDKAEKDRHPINCVDWEQARAYCKWADKYLPTEAQWEYAARGKDGRKYPWDNDKPSARLLNACGTECRELGKRAGQIWSVMYEESDGAEATAEVGRYPQGKSPFGAMDMAGNVWEWVADWYADHYPAQGNTIPEDPRGPDAGTSPRRVVRGGGWDDDDTSRVRAAYRYWNDVSNRLNYVGFRCARGPK
jgi:formylglycine-generating enzyme required for sulfatase activity